jgi:ribose-phosphate pyrophosphokinase
MDVVVGPKDGFSERIAEGLGIPFIELERIVFPDLEIKPRINADKGQIEGRSVLLVNRAAGGAGFRPNRHMLEFLFSIRNLKDLGARRVIVLMPYLIYARQDKVFLPGEPLSARHVFEMLKDAGADRLVTITSHVHRVEGEIKYYPHLDSYNISAFPVIGEYLKNNYKLQSPIVVGPDFRAGSGAKEVAQSLGVAETVFEKERDRESGKITMHAQGQFSGKDVVIVDDIAATGGTMEKAVAHCKGAGANRVICVVVHPVLAKNCLERVRNAGADFISVNTLESEISKIDIVPRIVEYFKK